MLRGRGSDRLFWATMAANSGRAIAALPSSIRSAGVDRSAFSVGIGSPSKLSKCVLYMCSAAARAFICATKSAWLGA